MLLEKGAVVNDEGVRYDNALLLTARTTWRAPRLGERPRVLTRLGTLYL
jgi:hypothetical protein